MSEARAKLQARKETVNLAAVGLQGGIYSGFTTIDVRALEDAVVRYGVAQALLDGIATTEEGLAVRDILPDKDLRDKNNVAITKREWRQPWSGSYNSEETEVQIYQTNKDTDNNQKIIVLYGVRLGGIYGPGRVGTEGSATLGNLATSSLIFKRASVKTIDIWQIEQLLTTVEGVAFARTPLLFKKNDNARIDAFPKTGASGSSDSLIFLGKTIEALGNNVTG